jgi:hypothetical protein
MSFFSHSDVIFLVLVQRTGICASSCNVGRWTCVLDRCRWLRDIHIICDRFISKIIRFISRVYFILFILHFHVHFLWSCICAFFCIKTVIWQYKWLYFRNLKKYIRSALIKDMLLVYPISVAHCQKDAILVWIIPVAHSIDGALRVMYIFVAHQQLPVAHHLHALRVHTRSACRWCATDNILPAAW